MKKIVLIACALASLTACAKQKNNADLDSGSRASSALVEKFSKDDCNIVHFDFDRANLKSEAVNKLKSRVNLLTDEKKLSSDMVVVGHADDRGADDYNLALSQKRAEAVEKFLRTHGVQGNIETVGKGKSEPSCTEHNEECYSKNRRAVVMLK
jgi:peptidoglycan-associated lipoprotein